MRTNDEYIELLIDSLAFEGVSVARHEGKVYFVKGALPGERIKAKILRKRKSYVEAHLIEVLEKSDKRIDADCSYFGVCGGCSWQNLIYSEQLRWKKIQIEDAFRRIGKLDYGEIKDVMPAERQFAYRNKMEFSFGTSRWITQDEIDSGADVTNKSFALGLHIPGRFDKVLDLDNCSIQPAEGNDVLNSIKEKAVSLGLSAYNLKTHVGFLRSIIIRKSVSRGELMVILISRSPQNDDENEFIDWFSGEFPKTHDFISHIVWAENNSFSPVPDGKITYIKGSDYLTENILGVDFRISPFSFFQTNSYQLNNFIGAIIDTINAKQTNIIWDLYCGTGSISLPVAKTAKKVYGVELVSSSIDDARENAKLNGIDNAEFYCYDLHSPKVNEFLSQLPKPDIIVIDPPRSGVHKNLLEQLNEFAPPGIVYVSCNPATQARDCQALYEKYAIESLQPVDMFPHTYHIENIALLSRRS